MIYSDVKFSNDSTEKLLAGAKLMADAVSSTLGPMGKNVAIANASMYGEIWRRFVVHDGVTVANSISLHDEFMDMGAQIVRQAAQKTVDAVGDGTTVSTLLSYAIFEQLHQLMAAGVNPMLLRKSLEKAVEELSTEITKASTPVETYQQLLQIATISAQDEVLGTLVAKTIDEMGADGLVIAEESKSSDTTVEKQKGMQIDKGWIHPFFMTNPEKMEATLENPLLLVTDKSITDLKPIEHILRYSKETNRPLFIMTPHFGEEALGFMADNKRRGVVYSLIVQAPSFGQDQKNKLQDIAIYTGGRYISTEAGSEFEEIKPEELGECQYITSSKTDTIIVGGKGAEDAKSIRIKELETALKIESVEFDKRKLEERLAKFTTGVGVIKVGGATEVEMKERMERAKDAIAACKAAKKHGIVRGGETIYLTVREILKKNTEKDATTRMAHDLLYAALYKPFQKLLTNAGLNDGEWYEKLKHAKATQGVNVMKGELVDMLEEGIIDPVLVPLEALRNASSTAIQLATIGTTIIQKMDWKSERPKP